MGVTRLKADFAFLFLRHLTLSEVEVTVSTGINRFLAISHGFGGVSGHEALPNTSGILLKPDDEITARLPWITSLFSLPLVHYLGKRGKKNTTRRK